MASISYRAIYSRNSQLFVSSTLSAILPSNPQSEHSFPPCNFSIFSTFLPDLKKFAYMTTVRFNTSILIVKSQQTASIFMLIPFNPSEYSVLIFSNSKVHDWHRHTRPVKDFHSLHLFKREKHFFFIRRSKQLPQNSLIFKFSKSFSKNWAILKGTYCRLYTTLLFFKRVMLILLKLKCGRWVHVCIHILLKVHTRFLYANGFLVFCWRRGQWTKWEKYIHRLLLYT